MNPLTGKIARMLANAGPILAVVFDALGHRARLASVEASEARLKLVRYALMLTGALIVACFGAFLLAFAVAAAVWSSEYRFLILGILSVVTLGGAATLAGLAVSGLRSWEPFGEILRQLSADGDCLRDLLSKSGVSESD